MKPPARTTMEDMLLPIYSRLRSSFVSLVCGILLSASVNILSGLLLMETLPKYWLIFLFIALALLISAVLLYLVTPTIDEVHRLWAMAKNEPTAWKAIIKPYIPKLNFHFLLGFLFLVASLVTLVISIVCR